VHTPERFGELNASVVDTVLNVLTIILVAMTAIGYLGLVATLGLATLERRRELVMLRAIGAGVGQVRHMVWGEAAAVGFLAASIGLTAGAGLGALAIRIGAIGSASEVVIPWRNNLFIGLGSICVAVAISMKVARRASLVPPAEAGR
jgi:putative ABC transport system permease protein